jgi:hypothetical protein
VPRLRRSTLSGRRAAEEPVISDQAAETAMKHERLAERMKRFREVSGS